MTVPSLAHRIRPLHLIIIGALLVRLVNVTAPIIGVHSWRQADTAAMARNFYQGEMNILYPQVDWGGNTPGYVESEFPIYQYVVALLYSMFGPVEACARALSIVASIMGIVFFYLLVARILGERTANWATAFYAFLPLNLFYGRAAMPETMMLMFLVTGVYAFVRWIDEGERRFFMLSAASIALACLSKLPSLYIGLPLAYLAWTRHKWGFLRRPSLWGYAALVLVPVGLWYYHSHQILLNGGLTFGIWEYSQDKWGNWGLVATIDFWNKILFQGLSERHLTWLGLPLVIAGLSSKKLQPKERLFDFWLLAVLVYTVIVAKGNYVHEYYQLPAMIPLPVFMGKAMNRVVWERWWQRKWTMLALLCVLGTVVLSLWRYSNYLSQEEPSASIRFYLAGKIKDLTPDKALIGVLDNSNPTILYLAARKGWRLDAASLDHEKIRRLASTGMKYWAGVRADVNDESWRSIEELSRDYHVLYADGNAFLVSAKTK